MPFAPVARAQGTGGAAACFPAGVDMWHHGDRLGGVDHDWRYTNLGVTYGLGSAM